MKFLRTKLTVILFLLLSALVKHMQADTVLPLHIASCEFSECGPSPIVMSFSGMKGQASFKSGQQSLVIEHFDNNSIAIRLSELDGQCCTGWTGLYLGKIEGTHITGVVSFWSRPGTNAHLFVWSADITGYQPVANNAGNLSKSAPPSRMRECEGDGCHILSPSSSVLWTFNGVEGIGKFAAGDEALTIECFTQDLIVVRRTDTSGPTKGLNGLYLGRIENGQITGGVIFYKPGEQAKGIVTSWSGTLEDPFAAKHIPPHLCRGPG